MSRGKEPKLGGPTRHTEGHGNTASARRRLFQMPRRPRVRRQSSKPLPDLAKRAAASSKAHSNRGEQNDIAGKVNHKAGRPHQEDGGEAPALGPIPQDEGGDQRADLDPE